ncbi:MAG: HAD family hydrolase [Janthinobacterium lividum]
MQNLTLFDLDHTLLPIDSDYEWGQFMTRIGAVEPVEYARRNAEFFAQYQNGTLDPQAYLLYLFGTLARFPRTQLDAWHGQFMDQVIRPVISSRVRELIRQHQQAGDLVAIVTATNRFITEPIARELGVEHLVAAEPELHDNGDLTGAVAGTPNHGAGKIVNTRAWLATLGHALEDFDRSTFYSDSQNDIPLMELVTHPVATNPNAVLAAHAAAHGWPIIHLFDQVTR